MCIHLHRNLITEFTISDKYRVSNFNKYDAHRQGGVVIDTK